MNGVRLTKALVVMVEDHRFYSHFGIDPWAVLRALVHNLQKRKYAEGGSTITQQLARTRYLTPRKTLFRKILEAVSAVYLELKYSKEEILDAYLREVYMGQTHGGQPVVGLFNAARVYFGEELEWLTVEEVAALVGMLRGPNLYKLDSDRLRVRMTTILAAAAKENLVSSVEFAEALYRGIVRRTAEARL